MPIDWQYFPKSDELPGHLKDIVDIFCQNEAAISSSQHELPSDDVLAVVRQPLLNKNYRVEISKKSSDIIRVPVLFGRNGNLEKFFQADAYNATTGTVLEVEAGRAYVNYQFLKDLFEACMMHDVDFLAIAVRKTYKGGPDFEKVCSFFDTLYASRRLQLPLKGILVLGY
jgi:hypothetical protein